eukprot:CAMPEP_0204826810 /NCGR_PEP_ID=MMETSP1346-20131115/4424_1 /ASSEMBLY_ACC=CAM_ASM_000771 /TAXON_ID=215587 /ORGANISM="Aplanochytrium stocchinoi, Strain GSBS06" /LENGTH=97 /DNA_ID=CAMNT_0051954991 /DNA_START=456 /DNA_END=749 /DNA_ORIENTATION=+
MHDSPWWVNEIMRDNFKSPLGVLVAIGLFGTPVWVLLQNTKTKWLPEVTDVYGIDIDMEKVEYLIGGILVAGRILALCVESHVLKLHFSGLARMHTN